MFGCLRDPDKFLWKFDDQPPKNCYFIPHELNNINGKLYCQTFYKSKCIEVTGVYRVQKNREIEDCEDLHFFSVTVIMKAAPTDFVSDINVSCLAADHGAKALLAILHDFFFEPVN